MQIIYQNENERSGSQRTDSVGVIICAGRVGRCLERKYTRRFRGEVARV